MSIEEKGGIHSMKDAKWEDYRRDLFRREPKLAQMIFAGQVRVEWKEDNEGNPEYVKIFKNNENTPFFFETVETFSRAKDNKTLF